MGTKFLVLHTQRSGGMVLSDALHALGLMAPVGESALYLGYGAALGGVFEARLKALLAPETTWGYRLDYAYLRHLLTHLSDKQVRILAESFDQSLIITRDDVTRQAIAGWVATQTGIHTYQDLTLKDPAVTSDELMANFSPDVIDQRVADIGFQTKFLEEWAGGWHDVYSTSLEKYLKAPATSLRAICEFLEVTPPSKIPTDRTMRPLNYPVVTPLVEAYLGRGETGEDD